MADIADEAGGHIEFHQQQQEAAIRRAAGAIPRGEPGDCDECGEPSQRLVLGVCAPCRDLLEEIRKRY
jgi:hypothetical protein